MSRRALVVLGTVTGVGVLALSSLAVLGSAPSTAEADGWSGWTGRVDTAAVSDRAAMTPDDDVSTGRPPPPPTSCMCRAAARWPS